MTTSKKQKVEQVQNILDRDGVGRNIGDLWDSWKNSRRAWEDEKKEIREYIFATDTSKTTNKSLPWMNKTTIPKLAQIRDNLHANYMASLFPRRKWFRWQFQEKTEDAQRKRQAIEAYMLTKIEDGDFREVMQQLVLDYIDYGNAFAEVIFERNVTEDESRAEITGFVGPRVIRINPMDIVFDVTASRFEDAPHIVRSIKTLGQLHRDRNNVATSPDEKEQYDDIIEYVKNTRMQLGQYTDSIIDTGAGFNVDGFTTVSDYYRSGYVEILQYDGDLFDEERGELHENKRIIVVDRSKVLWMGENPSWLGTTNKQHVGWRVRPDNLMAMGPLDNLVGMQYRIDHLENVKADVWDLVAYPPIGIKGDVDAFVWGPLEQIHMGDDAELDLLTPETQALNADLHIQQYENQMEEMAGAPKQAMGIRTPGEKTAFEVQQLQNAASRIFDNKTKQFEAMFVEPILNKMLEAARRNLRDGESVREFDDTFGIEAFLEISPEDITAAGKMKPIGARHFAEKAQIAQTVVGLYQSGIMQDPSVKIHLSGKRIAKLLEEVLNLEEFDLARDNIGLMERTESAALGQSAATQLGDEAAASELETEEPPQEE